MLVIARPVMLGRSALMVSHLKNLHDCLFVGVYLRVGSMFSVRGSLTMSIVYTDYKISLWGKNLKNRSCGLL